MIKIEIIDPQLEDEKTLMATARYLLHLAGHDMAMVIPNKPKKFTDIKEKEVTYPTPMQDNMPKNSSKESLEKTPPLHYIPTPQKFDVISSSNLMDIQNASDASIVETYIPSPEVHEAFSAMDSEQELDSKNNPWDSRIHSRTKSKNTDGTWKLKRGLTPPMDSEIDLVIEEGLIPVPPEKMDASKVFAGVPPAPVGTVRAKVEEEPEEEKQDLTGFFTLLNLVTKVIEQKKIEQHEIEAICRAQGVQSLPLMAQHPEKISIVIQEIEKIVGAR